MGLFKPNVEKMKAKRDVKGLIMALDNQGENGAQRRYRVRSPPSGHKDAHLVHYCLRLPERNQQLFYLRPPPHSLLNLYTPV